MMQMHMELYNDMILPGMYYISSAHVLIKVCMQLSQVPIETQ